MGLATSETIHEGLLPGGLTPDHFRDIPELARLARPVPTPPVISLQAIRTPETQIESQSHPRYFEVYQTLQQVTQEAREFTHRDLDTDPLFDDIDISDESMRLVYLCTVLLEESTPEQQKVLDLSRLHQPLPQDTSPLSERYKDATERALAVVTAAFPLLMLRPKHNELRVEIQDALLQIIDPNNTLTIHAEEITDDQITAGFVFAYQDITFTHYDDFRKMEDEMIEREDTNHALKIVSALRDLSQRELALVTWLDDHSSELSTFDRTAMREDATLSPIILGVTSMLLTHEEGLGVPQHIAEEIPEIHITDTLVQQHTQLLQRIFPVFTTLSKKLDKGHFVPKNITATINVARQLMHLENSTDGEILNEIWRQLLLTLRSNFEAAEKAYHHSIGEQLIELRKYLPHVDDTDLFEIISRRLLHERDPLSLPHPCDPRYPQRISKSNEMTWEQIRWMNMRLNAQRRGLLP